MPALHDRAYLNTGTSGPIPLPSFEAQVELLRRFSDEGFSTPDVAEAYGEAIESARETIADLLHCDADEIVLTNSTSDGIGIVAHGLDWQPGDEIITSDLEHIAGIAPWLDAATRRGAKVVTLEGENGHLHAERFAEALTPRTKLICLSHICWTTGTVLPLKEICAIAREAGGLTLVDGAQSAGHIPVDVGDLGCDFYTVSGQKWVLGPEGTGALYVNKAVLEDVAPTRIGWSSLESSDPDDGTLTFHPNARRFETGIVHAPAYAALARSIEMLQAIGMDNVFARAVELSARARDGLSKLPGVKILSPADTPSGLLTFAVAEPNRQASSSVRGNSDDSGDDAPQSHAERLVAELWREHRVIIRSLASVPGYSEPALRASFHVFNTEADVDELVAGIAQLLDGD